MKKSALLLTCLATSCVLPSFELVPTLDDSMTGGTASAAGAGETQSGSPATNMNGEGGDGGSATTAGAGGKQLGGSTSAMSGAANGGTNGGGTHGGGSSSGGSSSGGTEAGGTEAGGTEAGGTDAGGSPAKCPTPPNVDFCNDACVDINTNDSHCGGCNTLCGTHEECSDGSCACVAGYSLCNRKCIKFETDDNCGSCGKACAGAQTCSGATCKVCPTGCAVLASPYTTVNDRTNFELKLTPAKNLTNAQVTVRLYGENVSANQQGLFVVFNDQLQYDGVAISFSGVDGWYELTYDLATSEVSTASCTKILFSFYPAPSDTPVNSKIYIDWIRIDNGAAGPWEFAASGAPLVFTNAQDTSVPAPSTVTGNVTWLGN